MGQNLIKKKSNGGVSQALINHTKMVINIGMRIGELMFKDADEKVKKDDFFRCLSMSLILHDFGKIHSGEKGKENHNRYSWAYAASRISGLLKTGGQCILSAILYHEFEVCENISSKKLMGEITEGQLAKMDYLFYGMKTYCEDTFGVSFSKYKIITKKSEFNEASTMGTPIYPFINITQQTDYDEAFAPNAKTQLIRAILDLSNFIIETADEECHEKLINNDIDAIDNEFYQRGYMQPISFNGEVSFDNACFDNGRIQCQKELLEKTFAHDHNVIQASAGMGKTLVGLMWFLHWRKRMVWVTPRNVFANGIYQSIMNELRKLGLEQVISVGLYYGGQIVQSNRESQDQKYFDILVTNIDNIVNKTADKTPGREYLTASMYTSHMVFDEYGDYVMQDGIFSAFIRLMHTRSRYTHSKSLLLSATAPNFNFLWGHDIVNYIKHDDVIYGDTKVKITYKAVETGEDVPIHEPSDDTVAICHTIADSQHVFRHLKKKCPDASLLHSRFTNDDKNNLIHNIIEKHGYESDVSSRHLVVGTSIIGTGLDISCKKMYDFVVSPEATIQRCCGRCSRFGEYDEVEYHVLATLKPSRALLSREYDTKLRSEWQKILLAQDGKTLSKKELYELYWKFQKDNEQAIKKFYASWFNMSSDALSNIQLYITRKTKTKDVKRTLPDGFGYRGVNNGVFVTAKNIGETTWCSQIIVDFDLITNKASDRREEENTNERKAVIRDGEDPEFYKVFERQENKNDLKYRFQLKDYTNDEMLMLGRREKTPMPLFNFQYSTEYGLIHKMDL